MDLDEMKGKSKAIKAPGTNWGDSRQSDRNLDDLVGIIKAADIKDKKMLKTMKRFFFIGTLIYAFLFILQIFAPSNASHGFSFLATGLYALIFMAIVIFFREKGQGLERIDYTLPVMEFLKVTERRYRFFRWSDYYFAIPVWIVLIYAAALYIISTTDRYWGSEHRLTGLALYGVFIIIVFAAGYFFSWKNWKKDKGMIREEIIRMRSELEGNGSAS